MNVDPAPRLTVVIVTWNSRGHIDAALQALRVVREAGDLGCVVVDNCSRDGTAAFVEQTYPWVRVVRSGDNLGFGRGCNLGAKGAESPYLLFLNPDAVIERDSLDILLEFIEARPEVGVAGPAIIEGQGESVQKAGLMTTPAGLLRTALGLGRSGEWGTPIIPGGQPFKTNWICGAVMLVRTEAFRRAGGFDPRFFLYFEETDLCRRIASEGYQLWAVGEAIARHEGGASAIPDHESSGPKYISEHFYRSRFYYLVKHFGWVKAVGAEVITRMLDAIRRGRNRLLGRTPRHAAGGKRPFLRFPAPPRDPT